MSAANCITHHICDCLRLQLDAANEELTSLRRENEKLRETLRAVAFQATMEPGHPGGITCRRCAHINGHGELCEVGLLLRIPAEREAAERE